ncbi:hypothetical protein HK097_009967 [Rhizophlyctis rosea]|uniref:BZIP domain-containing protein n=1 Tax=Rhizophlyctis rosea TaxID=64517 RepID=A0AAD5SB18_9FUNG|nr:hypothetical protein HK097_009967 [Rhizophlyctis rosea]
MNEPNYDYLQLLNLEMPSPPKEVDTADDLDLWLNTDFVFDPLDAPALANNARTEATHEQVSSPLMHSPLTPTQHGLTSPAAYPGSVFHPGADHTQVKGKVVEEELDKRRRNTAASARFRAKKKQREQLLEKTAKEMTEKAETLERRVKEYEMELKWLRQLVTDRDGKKRLRDIYEENGMKFVEGTYAAGSGPEAFPIIPAANVAAAAAVFANALALAQQQPQLQLPLALPLPDAKRPRLASAATLKL